MANDFELSSSVFDNPETQELCHLLLKFFIWFRIYRKSARNKTLTLLLFCIVVVVVVVAVFFNMSLGLGVGENNKKSLFHTTTRC